MELNFTKMAYDVQDSEMFAEVSQYHNEAMALFWSKNPNLSEVEKAEVMKPLKVRLSNSLRMSGGNANIFSIELNYRMLKANPNVLKEIYVHELAHVLTERIRYSNGESKSVGHGHKWKIMMMKLGQVPSRFVRVENEYLPEPKKRNLIG